MQANDPQAIDPEAALSPSTIAPERPLAPGRERVALEHKRRLRWLGDFLGDDSPVVRAEVQRQLLGAGKAARPLLRRAEKSADPKVRSRARALLGEQARQQEPAPAVLLRRLAADRPRARAVPLGALGRPDARRAPMARAARHARAAGQAPGARTQRAALPGLRTGRRLGSPARLRRQRGRVPPPGQHPHPARPGTPARDAADAQRDLPPRRAARGHPHGAAAAARPRDAAPVRRHEERDRRSLRPREAAHRARLPRLPETQRPGLPAGLVPGRLRRGHVAPPAAQPAEERQHPRLAFRVARRADAARTCSTGTRTRDRRPDEAARGAKAGESCRLLPADRATDRAALPAAGLLPLPGQHRAAAHLRAALLPADRRPDRRQRAPGDGHGARRVRQPAARQPARAPGRGPGRDRAPREAARRPALPDLALRPGARARDRGAQRPALPAGQLRAAGRTPDLRHTQDGTAQSNSTWPCARAARSSRSCPRTSPTRA